MSSSGALEARSVPLPMDMFVDLGHRHGYARWPGRSAFSYGRRIAFAAGGACVAVAVWRSSGSTQIYSRRWHV